MRASCSRTIFTQTAPDCWRTPGSLKQPKLVSGLRCREQFSNPFVQHFPTTCGLILWTLRNTSRESCNNNKKKHTSNTRGLCGVTSGEITWSQKQSKPQQGGSKGKQTDGPHLHRWAVKIFTSCSSWSETQASFSKTCDPGRRDIINWPFPPKFPQVEVGTRYGFLQIKHWSVPLMLWRPTRSPYVW